MYLWICRKKVLQISFIYWIYSVEKTNCLKVESFSLIVRPCVTRFKYQIKAINAGCLQRQARDPSRITSNGSIATDNRCWVEIEEGMCFATIQNKRKFLIHGIILDKNWHSSNANKKRTNTKNIEPFNTCRFVRNMPELVRPSLITLFPELLSATMDFSNLSFAWCWRPQS